MKIIVADDTKEVREALCISLVRAGHEVVVFAYPDQVEEAIPNGWADLLITDFDFGPGCKSGAQLIKDLRAKGWEKPIALLSGASLKVLEESVRGVDGVTCIVKCMDSHTELERFIGEAEGQGL